MRGSLALLTVVVAGLSLPAIRADEKLEEYLKDGKLKERIQVLELRGNFKGYSGTYYQVEPDGTWSTGSVGPSLEVKGEPRAQGKLTADQLKQLGKSLAQYDVAHLASIAPLTVNPKVVMIRFGATSRKFSPDLSKPLPESVKAIKARYDGVVEALKACCKEGQ